MVPPADGAHAGRRGLLGRHEARRHPHVAFGHGTHFCLGANLARMEIRLVLDAILDRFDGVVPTGPVERTRSNKHTGVRHAPVELVPRAT
ncbi:MAG TPA: cytochrome P450 [Acidimicrobiales bacterium]|nr:cytochrome P450 [Acidimicrobiales bacterium]